MAVPKKPTWFRKRDIVIPYSLPVFSAVVSVLVFIQKDLKTTAGDPVPRGLIGIDGFMVLLTLAFAFIAFVWVRKWVVKLREFEYVRGPYYAVMVHRGKYTAAYDDDQVIDEFEAAFKGWSKVYGADKIKDFADDALFWLWFEPFPITDRSRGKDVKLAGLTIGGTRTMKVAYRDPDHDPVKTALQHEIGHLVQGHITGLWVESVHHENAKKHGLR